VSFRHLPRISWARRDRCFRRRPTRRAPRPGAPDPPLATNPQESERELIAVTEFNENPENFKGKLIQVLWPDTGKWYNAEVIKVNGKNRTAKLFYVDSEEKEDINLYEAMLNMEVSWPFKGGVVGKTPASSEKKRKTRDESPPPSSSSDDDAPRNPRPKKKTTANAPKKAAPAKRPPGAGAGPSDEARRVFAEKVKDAMLVATNELGGKAGEKNSEFDPASAADGVERAAFALFGKDVKKYNDKARSLLFNLKDPKNPSLRARVLTGELQPEALARMTPADLARRDLQEMRREREARLGEDAFLTAGPATRLVKTSKGEELVVVGGGEVVEEGDGLGNRKEETLAQQVAAAASAAAAGGGGGAPPPRRVSETRSGALARPRGGPRRATSGAGRASWRKKGFMRHAVAPWPSWRRCTRSPPC
jgi:collagen type III alpha